MTIKANTREIKNPEGAGVQWTPLPQAEAPTDLERRLAMTAKEYLLQARYLDERINSKIQQIASLNELATRCHLYHF